MPIARIRRRISSSEHPARISSSISARAGWLQVWQAWLPIGNPLAPGGARAPSGCVTLNDHKRSSHTPPLPPSATGRQHPGKPAARLRRSRDGGEDGHWRKGKPMARSATVTVEAGATSYTVTAEVQATGTCTWCAPASAARSPMWCSASTRGRPGEGRHADTARPAVLISEPVMTSQRQERAVADGVAVVEMTADEYEAAAQRSLDRAGRPSSRLHAG